MNVIHSQMPIHSKEILKGIPIDKRRIKGRYPFEKMDVEDAFFPEDKNPSASASKYGIETGKKFTVRSNYEHNGLIGWMCWRVS